MELERFISLVATIFGTLGAIYVMLGILSMTPELMERQTQSFWDYSIPQIESLAKQKADSISGFTFIIIAFTLSIINIIFVPDSIEIFKSKAVAIALAAVLSGAMFISLHYISAGIYKNQRTAICKVITSKFYDSIFEKGYFDNNDAISLKDHAESLLGLKVNQDQDPKMLFREVGKIINKDIPATIDYSKLSNNNK